MAYEKVKAFFEARGLSGRISVHDTPSDTVAHAAEVCGCTEAQIAKTMSFAVSSGAVLIVAAGDVKIQSAKFKAYFHEKAVMLPFAEVEAHIGHAPGGVCPFAVNAGVKVYIDESLRRFSEIHVAGGAENVTVRLSVDELFTLSGAADYIDVCKPINEQ